MTKNSRRLLSVAIGVGLGAVLVVAGCQPVGQENVGQETVDRGTVQLIKNGPMMPDLYAEGWVNGSPDGGSLQGKVVVFDFWFTTCGPCQAATPELVAAYQAYRDRGVQFMGLTFESSEQLPAINAFIRRFGTTWPIAYGAVPTIEVLGVAQYPTLIVFGRDGRTVWRSDKMAGSLEQVLDEVLKE